MSTPNYIEHIPASVAEELYELSDGEHDETGTWTRVTDVEGDSGRWEQHHILVIQHRDGQHYGIAYSLGLTENQDSTLPWRGDGWTGEQPETVDVFRLYPVQIVVTQWTKKPVPVAPDGKCC